MGLTAERLRELLDYDVMSGVFTRRVKRGNQQAGAIAGTLHHSGYVQIAVDGVLYLSQRLAFLWMLGRFPLDGLEVDHKDTDKQNNAWVNLREVTKAQNAWNVKRLPNNLSGVKGVNWRSDKKKWEARVRANGKIVRLGYFDSVELATEFRQLAADMLHGDFARHA